MIALGLQTILPPGREAAGPWEQGYRLWRHLDRLCPSAIAIAGYAAPEMLAALAWCRRRKRLAILMSASKEDDAIRHPWKERIKGWLVGGYHAAVVGGGPQRRYLEELGFPPEAIFLSHRRRGQLPHTTQSAAPDCHALLNVPIF